MRTKPCFLKACPKTRFGVTPLGGTMREPPKGGTPILGPCVPGTFFSHALESDTQIRQRIADSVDNLDQARVGLLEALDRRSQALQRQLQKLGVLVRAGGFVRGHLGKAGNALRLFAVSL